MTPDDAQADSKTCLPLYSLADKSVFGWRYIDTSDGMANALVNGQYCKSGIAIYTGNYQAMCTQIVKIRSDLGDVAAPYTCSVANPKNTCRYYYNSLEYIT
jgi:hypothetical protein